MATFPRSVTDRASATEFVNWCVDTLGLAYHPDTQFEDYLNRVDESRCFTVAEAADLNAKQDQIFAFFDPYAIGLELFAKRFGVPVQ